MVASAARAVAAAALVAACAPRAVVAQTTPLAPGNETLGRVGFQSYVYYSATLGAESYALLTVLDGNADLLVNLGTGRPLPTVAAADYVAASQVWVPTLDILVQSTDAAWATNCGAAATTCAAVIGVYGKLASNYSIAVSGLPVNLTLIPGVPAVGVLPGVLSPTLGTLSFSLPVPNGPSAPTSLTSVSLTVTGLDLPLAVYFGSSLKGAINTFNAATYCDYWSYDTAVVKVNSVTFTSYNSDANCWCGPNAASPAQPFAGDCEFTVLVVRAQSVFFQQGGTAQVVGAYTGTGPQQLLDGIAVSGRVLLGRSNYYYFVPVADPNLPVPQRTVRIELDGYQGDADVFVTLDGSTPSPSNYLFASYQHGVGNDFITFDTTQYAAQCNTAPNAPAPCLVSIAVYGSAVTSSYLVTASFSSYITLLPGIPYQTYVGVWPEVALFRVPNSQPNASLTFTLTGISGNPRMVGGSDAPAYNGSYLVPQPYVDGSYLWGPVTYNNGGVYTVDPQAGPLQARNLLLGVAANWNSNQGSEFEIAATWPAGPSSFTLLTLGVPTLGATAAGAYTWYELVWPSPDVLSMTVDLQNRVGNVVMYAAYGSTFRTDYSATGDAFTKSIVVSQTDPQFQQRCPGGTAGCVLYISVYGAANEQRQFIITAFTNTQVLLEATPVQGVVQSYSWTYYMYYAPRRNNTLTFLTTPLSGTPAVFVSVTGTASDTNFQWSSATTPGGVLTVTWNEPVFGPGGAAQNATDPLLFSIGVFGAGGPAVFIMEARYTGTPVGPSYQRLTSGIPVAATLVGGNLSYFAYYVPPPTADGADPSFHFDVIPTTVTARRLEGRIVVGEFAGPTGGELRQRRLQAGSGATVVLVSNNATSPPLCAAPAGGCDGQAFRNYQWAGSSAATGSGGAAASVDVMLASPGFRNDTLYVIGVYSPDNVSATVMAVDTNTIAELPAGVPVPLSLPSGFCRFFELVFFGGSGSTDVELALTTAAGDGNLYVSYTPSNRRPTAAAYDAASTATGADPDSVTVRWAAIAAKGAPGTNSSVCDGQLVCTVYVSACGAAAGVTTESTIVGLLLNNSGFTPVTLEDGVPTVGFVPAGGTRYYTVSLSAADVRDPPYYSFILSPLGGGNPDLYIRLNGGTPSATSYDRSSAGTGVDYVTLFPSDGTSRYCAVCVVNVAVTAPADASASFYLTFATKGTPITLVSGVPFLELLPRGDRRLYLAPVPLGGAPDVTFSVASGVPPLPGYFVLPWATGTGSPGSGTVPPPMPNPGPASMIPGGTSNCRNLTGVASGTLFINGSAAAADRCACTYCTQVLSALCTTALGASRCEIGVTATVSAAGLPPIVRLTAGIGSDGVLPMRGSVNYYAFPYAGMLVPAPGGGVQLSHNITITVSTDAGAPPSVLVTNVFFRGTSPTANLPSSPPLANWTDARSQIPGFIRINTTDPAIRGCPNCTELVIGVAAAAGAASYRITAAVEDGVTVMALGRPTGAATVGANLNRRFMFTLPGGLDLAAAAAAGASVTLTATVLDGSVAISLDPNSGTPGCEGVPPAVSCAGQWVTVPADAPAGTLVLAATAPCAGANPAVPCNASAVWRPGPYYVTVYGINAAGSSVVSLLASLSTNAAGALITLVSGVPVTVPGVLPPPGTGVPASAVPLPPVFTYTSLFDPAPVPAAVRFAVSTRASGFNASLTGYLTSCVVGRCRDSVTTPTPANAAAVFTLAPAATATLRVAPGAPGYCNDPTGRSPCAYYFTLVPSCVDAGGSPIPTPGSPSACTPATFVITATTEGQGSGGTDVPADTLSGGAIYEAVGFLPGGNATDRYEVYLPPVAGGGAGQFTAVLEASGPADATLFVCDPSLVVGTDANACANAFAPSAAQFSYALSTSAPQGATSAPGRTTLSIPATRAEVLYFAVGAAGSRPPPTTVAAPGGDRRRGGRDADGSGDRDHGGDRDGSGDHMAPRQRTLRVRDHDGGASRDGGFAAVAAAPICPPSPPGGPPPGSCTYYRLLLAAGPAAVLLAPPTVAVPAYNVTADVSGTTAGVVNVTYTWPPFSGLPLASGGAPIGTLSNGIRYAVYAAAGGFRADLAVNTSLGLDTWASASAVAPFTTPPLSGAAAMAPSLTMQLAANTFYQLAVVAICDAACWRANGVAAATTTLTLAAPAIYSYNTSAGAVPVPPGGGGDGGGSNAAVLGGAIGGAVGGLLLLGALAVLVVRRRRAGGGSIGPSQPTRVQVVANPTAGLGGLDPAASRAARVAQLSTPTGTPTAGDAAVAAEAAAAIEDSGALPSMISRESRKSSMAPTAARTD